MASPALQIETVTNRSLEVVKTGIFTAPVTVSGTKTSVTLNHNLGYTPIIIAYIGLIDVPDIYLTMPYTPGFSIGSEFSIDLRYTVVVDDTKITAYTETATSAASYPIPVYNIRYYLLKEVAK